MSIHPYTLNLCGPHPPVLHRTNPLLVAPTHSPPFHTSPLLPSFPQRGHHTRAERDPVDAEMGTSDSDADIAAASSSSSSTTASPPASPPPAACLLRHRPRDANRQRRRRRRRQTTLAAAAKVEAEDVWRGAQWEAAWPGRRDPRPVLLAADDDGVRGGPGSADDGGVGRSRSLTDDDLEELKGCADLGFGFSYDEIPELRGTLPALELCYSMTQRLGLDDHHHHADTDAATPPVTNWKISSPGDSPDEVKARLKYWAQAVACTVRLCS